MERTRIRGAWLAALAALGFVIPACNEGDVADYMSWTKAVAAEHDGRSGDVDVCHSRGWYEDGVCDTFCAAPDPDCRDPETACMADEECGAARFCDTSACLSCCPDAPPGTACIAACCGVCRDRTSDYDACMADEDCAAGEACDTSECLSCCPDAPPGTDCIAACCGRCTAAECTSDAECDAGAEWCEGGFCVPCDNSGLVCDLYCPAGFVPPRNGCQPCICASYVPCMGDGDCAADQVCDATECLSCCPDAPPGTDCIAACCGQCIDAPTATCATDADCAEGAEWCEGGLCVPCDNGGAYCDLVCPAGFVPPRNGCQPCICAPSYEACMSNRACGEGRVCDLTDCLSCCPDAPPGSPCIDVCCGRCVDAPTDTCATDADCAAGAEWCEGGVCVPCDNTGLVCDLWCPAGLVPPRNGCQPCICAPSYVPCLSNEDCPERCDTTECLSCCPDAPPGTPCIDVCCGQCVPWGP